MHHEGNDGYHQEHHHGNRIDECAHIDPQIPVENQPGNIEGPHLPIAAGIQSPFEEITMRQDDRQHAGQRDEGRGDPCGHRSGDATAE